MEHPVISSFDPSKLFLPQYLLSERGHKPHQRCAIPHHGWRISPIFMVCLIYSFVRWGKAERSLIRLHIEAIQQTYRGISFYGCGNKSFLLIPPKKAEKTRSIGYVSITEGASEWARVGWLGCCQFIFHPSRPAHSLVPFESSSAPRSLVISARPSIRGEEEWDCAEK